MSLDNCRTSADFMGQGVDDAMCRVYANRGHSSDFSPFSDSGAHPKRTTWKPRGPQGQGGRYRWIDGELQKVG